MANSQYPLRYDLDVPPNGRIELQLPLPVGSHVTIYVLDEQSEFDDLLMAASSSTDFWDNPQDDEDWNNA